MAFLDNSGDIILDAVLTDSGRARLAKGDGSFRIVKFALGDDEIDYENYNKNTNTANADLQILQTPILEALTNDDSSMKSKLISIPRTNAGLIVASSATTSPTGILNGFNPGGAGAASIRTDQGLNTNEIPPTETLDSLLLETQYIVTMDNRFGSLVDPQGNSASKSFVDDDNIATYVFSKGQGNGQNMIGDIGTSETTNSSIKGPRGTFFNFKILASNDLRTSTFLFEQLGTPNLSVAGAATLTCRFIDTNISVMGATTGFKVDIPVRFVKKQ